MPTLAQVKIGTLADIIRREFPDTMARFDKAPWDFKVIATDNNLDDDAAQFWVQLQIGKKRCEEMVNFRIYVVAALVIREDEEKVS